MKKIQYITPTMRVVRIAKTPILSASEIGDANGTFNFSGAKDGDDDEEADARRGGFLWDEY